MTIRWGIIGCGNVTEVKSGPGFQQASDSALVAVMRRDAARAADYATRHGVPRWYDAADALIADPEVDAVYIATPPGTHAEYALRACQAGKPVYVEKPMARNHEECLAMLEAFHRADLKLFVAYYRRALPRFLEVKQRIDAGRLGTVIAARYVYAAPPQTFDANDLPWRFRAAESGGGLFFDVGSHALDLLDFLLGPLLEIEGKASSTDPRHAAEDRVELRFRTAEGVEGTASWDFASPRSEDAMEIRGTHGTLTFAVFGKTPHEWRTARAKESFDIPNPLHIEQPMIQTVVDDLLGRGVCRSTGYSAARTSAVMDHATLGYYGTRAIGFWDRANEWPGGQIQRRQGPG